MGVRSMRSIAVLEGIDSEKKKKIGRGVRFCECLLRLYLVGFAIFDNGMMMTWSSNSVILFVNGT